MSPHEDWADILLAPGQSDSILQCFCPGFKNILQWVVDSKQRSEVGALREWEDIQSGTGMPSH